MRRLTLTLIALLVVTLAAPAGVQAQPASKAHFPVTVVDDHGNRVHLLRAPRRIISLDPRDTESLFAIDAESRIVADGGQYVEGAAGISRSFRYPSEWPSRWGRNYPVRSKTLPHVEGGCCGTHFNLETVESLHPDLVVGPYSTAEAPTFDRMRELGLRVLILDPANLKGIFHDLAILGVVTGNTSQASAVVMRMHQQLKSVSSHLKHITSHPRVYYEVDATNPTEPYTVGPGTFIDEAIRRAGGTNIGHSVTTCFGTLCYPQVSLEAIVRANPQVILLGDAGYSPPVTAASVRTRTGWETISAVRSGKIYPFNDELISRAGPRIAIGIAKMAKLLHPSAFGS